MSIYTYLKQLKMFTPQHQYNDDTNVLVNYKLELAKFSEQ